MPTPQNKLVPIEAAYSDDEGEVALVKENKQASHLLCGVGSSSSLTCSVNLSWTPDASKPGCCTNLQFLMSRVNQQHFIANFDDVLHAADLLRTPRGQHAPHGSHATNPVHMLECRFWTNRPS